QLAAEADQAHATVGADLVIMGGARLSPYAAALRQRTRLVVVEPVACGIAMAEALARIGLRQSKLGKFARPPAEHASASPVAGHAAASGLGGGLRPPSEPPPNSGVAPAKPALERGTPHARRRPPRHGVHSDRLLG